MVNDAQTMAGAEMPATPETSFLQVAALQTTIDVTRSRNLDDALTVALGRFVELADAKSGSILLFNETNHALKPVKWHGVCWSGGRQPRTFKLGEGIAGSVAETRQPYYCPDVRSDPLYLSSPAGCSLDVRTLLCAPILGTNDALLGVINLDSTIVDAFSIQTQTLLIEFSHPIAAVIEKAMLLEQSQNSLRERDLLLEVGRIISSSIHDLPELLRQICRCAVKVVNDEASSNAYLYDPSKEPWKRRFSARQQYGERRTVGKGRCPRPEVGMGAWVLAHGQEKVSTSLNEIHPDKLKEGAQAAVCLPLKFGGEIVGILYVYLREPRSFTSDELRLLKDFADTAAIAIKNARLLDSLDRTVRAFTVLQDITVAIAAQRDLETILNLVVEKALEVTGTTRGWIKFMVLEDVHPALRDILGHQAQRGFDADYMRLPLRPGQGISGTVAAEGEPVLVHDVRSYLRGHPEIPPGDTPSDTRSKLAVPLQVGSKTIGVLNLESVEPGVFSLDDLHVVSTIAAHAAITLRDAIVSRIDRLVTSSLELQDFLEMLLDVALLFTNARHGTLRLVDKQSRDLELKVHRGEGEVPQRLKIGPEESIVGQVAYFKHPLLIGDVTRAPWKDHYSPITMQPIRSALAVPLLGPGDEVEGVLDVESASLDGFTIQSQSLLEDLAARATLAIQRARLLLAMNEVSTAMAQGDEQVLFKVIVRQARDLLNAPVSALWILDPADPECLVLREALGHPGLQNSAFATLQLNGLIGEAIDKNGPVSCSDVRKDTRFLRPEVASQQDWRSTLIVPLSVADGRPLGALSIYTLHEERYFSQWEQDLLTALGQHAAIAIQNTYLLRHLAQTEKRQAIIELFAGIGYSSANLVHLLTNKMTAIRNRVARIQNNLATEQQVGPELVQPLDEINRLEKEAREAVTEWKDRLVDPEALSLETVSIRPCVAQALQGVAIPPGIQVRVKCDDVTVSGSDMLKHVFVNLFENAVEAMGDQGELSVSTHVEQGWVEVMVSDTGRGIQPEMISGLFQWGITTKKAAPAGMGLWLAQQLVRVLGGDILVTSPPGKGATFTVRLPAGATDGCRERGTRNVGVRSANPGR